MGQITLAGSQTLPRARTAPWHVTVATDPGAIGARWRAIEAEGEATAFQCREWLEAWYAAASLGGAEPLIVMIDDAAGACAMVLPLSVASEHGRRVIRFADSGVSDYTAPILGPAAPRDASQIGALWSAIRRALPPADLIVFDKMPGLVGLAANPLLWLGAGLSSQTQSACRLAEPWHLARQRLMPQAFRESLDGRKAKLARKARIAFRLAQSREEIDDLFSALVAQKEERAAAMGWDNILADPVWRDFYKRLALQGIGGGMARLMALTIDGAPASVILGLERHGRFCDLLTSFDATKWKRHSTGLLGLDAAMGFMASRGIDIYDLTIGAESYKNDFGPEVEPLYEYAEALSWRGMAPAMAMRMKSAVRRNPRLANLARQVAQSSRLSPAAATHLANHSPLGVVGTMAGL